MSITAWRRAAVFLVILVIFVSTAAKAASREYVIKQAGSAIGTVSISIVKNGEDTFMNTMTAYPDLGVEIQTTYAFSGREFPKRPVSYSYAILSGGLLNMDVEWTETARYTIIGGGQESPVDLGTANVLPLDNNVISDYMVATWIYDKESGGGLQSNVLVPVWIPQGIGMLPMTVSYIGEESVGGSTTDHFQVDVGVAVDVWVDQADRTLIKLHIPMQAFEIIAQGVDAEPEQAQFFTDFGGCSFSEEDFRIEVEQAMISGTLTIPDDAEAVPGVVLVAGSGPTDRDGNSYVMPGPANYLREIAHYLGSRGIAVLRFDKRGVGESSGPVSSFADYINDISALVDYLSGFPFADPERLFIIGHSEGAWLASEVAARRDDLRGIGLLAGAGYPFFDTVKRQMLQQSEAVIAAGLADEGLISRLDTALDELYLAVTGDKGFDVSLYGLPGEFEQLILSFEYQKELLKDWFKADPALVLSGVNVPALIIQGTGDVQIQLDDARRLAEAIPESQRELHIFEGVDHVLKMTDGEPLPYTDPSRRVDRQVLQVIGDWVLAR